MRVVLDEVQNWYSDAGLPPKITLPLDIKAVGKHWGWFLAKGILMILVGPLALGGLFFSGIPLTKGA
jgi:uncharacterized membrane protein HdeD (DUF308 family)